MLLVLVEAQVQRSPRFLFTRYGLELAALFIVAYVQCLNDDAFSVIARPKPTAEGVRIPKPVAV